MYLFYCLVLLVYSVKVFFSDFYEFTSSSHLKERRKRALALSIHSKVFEYIFVHVRIFQQNLNASLLLLGQEEVRGQFSIHSFEFSMPSSAERSFHSNVLS